MLFILGSLLSGLLMLAAVCVRTWLPDNLNNLGARRFALVCFLWALACVPLSFVGWLMSIAGTINRLSGR